MAYLPVSDIIVSLQPFNPKALVEAASVNILGERDTRDIVRLGLDSARLTAETALAAASLATNKAYSTSIDAHDQDMFITGFTKPTIIEQTAKQVESEGGIDSITEDCLSGELTDELLNESMLEEALNQVDTEMVEDLAIDAAGMYVCGATGGVVPPGVASAVIKGGVDYMKTGELDTGAIVKDAVLSEVGGGAFEGVTDQFLEGAASDLISSDELMSSFELDPDSYIQEYVDKVTDFAGSTEGMIGGINLEDTDMLESALAMDIVEEAAEAGNVSLFDKAVDYVKANGESLTDSAINLGSKMMQNPTNINTYTGLMTDCGVNLGSYLQSGTGFGCDAIKSGIQKAAVDSGMMSQKTYDNVTSKLSEAVNSKKFKRITNMGNQLARQNLDRSTYNKMLAITDVTKLATTGNVKNARRANRSVQRSAEKLFNDGKSFNTLTRCVSSYKNRSTVTNYAKMARDLVF